MTSDADAPVEIVFYEDFLCPVCRQFEQEVGSYIEEKVRSGAISVEYRPIAILDYASTTDYSTRAASAAACVFDSAGIDAFHTYHDLLYENQPPEHGAGLSDQELDELAGRAGAGDVGRCIDDHTYEDWVANATDQASQDNITGAQTVLVDGQVLTGPSGGVPTLPDPISAVTATS